MKKKIKYVYRLILSIPLILTLLSSILGAFPLIPWMGKIVLKWRIVTRDFWTFLLDLVPDWLIPNYSGRQLDLFTLLLILVFPPIVKQFKIDFISKPFKFLLSSAGVDTKAIETEINIPESYSIGLAFILVFYMSIESFTTWGVLRPVLSLIVAAIIISSIFALLKKGERISFERGYLLLILIIIIPKTILNILYQPGNLILHSFDLGQPLLVFGGSHSYLYKFFCIFFYAILILAFTFNVKVTPKSIALGIMTSLFILIVSKIYSLSTGIELLIDPYMDSLNER